MKVNSKKNAKKSKSVTGYPSLFMAGYLLVLLISQLWTFNRFPEVLMSMGLTQILAITLMVVLVVLEASAVLYLLRFYKINKVAKIGLLIGVLSLLLLSALELLAIFSGVTIIFGATLDVPGGGWSITFLLAMWILLAWSVVDRIKLNNR